MNERQLIIIGAIIIGSLIALAIIIGALIIKKEIQDNFDKKANSYLNSLGDSLSEFAKQQLDEKSDYYLKSLGDSLGKSLGDSLSEFAKQQGEKDSVKYKRFIGKIKSRPELLLIPPLAKFLDELED